MALVTDRAKAGSELIVLDASEIGAGPVARGQVRHDHASELHRFDTVLGQLLFESLPRRHRASGTVRTHPWSWADR